MSKKILSVVLALVLVLSTFALSAFAASKPEYEVLDEKGKSEYTQSWELKDASEDDVYKAEIYLETNYESVGAIQFKIESAGKADLVAVDSDVFVGDYDIQFSKEGLVFIVPTPAESVESMDAIDLTTKTLIATLTFELAEGADSATVTIKNDPKNEANPEGKLLAARVDDGNLVTGTSIVGQTVLAVAGSATFGAAPADLAKKAGAEAGIVIDTHKTFGGKYDGAVYGFTKGGKGGTSTTVFKTNDHLNNNLEATNGGSLVFTQLNKGYGTGATVTVKNSDGTTGKVYVVIIFGDVDCNGTIGVNDASFVKNALGGQTTIADNSIENMAANCQAVKKADVMHTIAINDASFIKNYVGTSATKFSPATLASYQYSFNTFYQ